MAQVPEVVQWIAGPLYAVKPRIAAGGMRLQRTFAQIVADHVAFFIAFKQEAGDDSRDVETPGQGYERDESLSVPSGKLGCLGIKGPLGE